MKIKADLYFSTPIYSLEETSFLKDLNKITDKYIEESKKNNEKILKERENFLNKKVGDHGFSFNSTSLIKDKKLDKFKNHIGNICVSILDLQGYDMSNHLLFFKELWVQEFAKNGGGHHDTHIHFNSHLSGFYFLKCSEKTSYPIFYDPRQGKNILQLPIKKETELNIATEMVNYKIKPGTLIIFPSYLPHQFVIDHGIDPFRFIHFNMQAISKDVL